MTGTDQHATDQIDDAPDTHTREEHSAELEPHAGHGHVVPASELEEPSAEWGWHATFPRATLLAGWFSAAVMFLMVLFGNHENWVEDAWLICIGTGMVIALVGVTLRRRTPWRH